MLPPAPPLEQQMTSLLYLIILALLGVYLFAGLRADTYLDKEVKFTRGGMVMASVIFGIIGTLFLQGRAG